MNIILEGIVGSTAYGLATADSDIDKLGIYLEPKEYFLGLDLRTEKDFSRVKNKPDISYHELGKFMRLCLQCNPTVTELLWLPDRLYTVRSDVADVLIQHRTLLLSAERVKAAYMGYATAQFKRLNDRGDFGSDLKKRTAKHARHLLRLMHQGYTLYTTGELPIVLEDPQRYHDFGKDVADEPSVASGMISWYSQLFEHATPAIPESPDRAALDSWLMDVRKSGYTTDED